MTTADPNATLPIRSLAIAAPAYNEAEGIEETICAWQDFLDRSRWRDAVEIVVCNDGSRDETGAILDRIAAATGSLRPVHLERNQGAAAALTAAIHHTAKDWVLLIDSDGQFPIENLDRMVAAVEKSGALAAIGVRAKKDGAIARFGSWASGVLCNLFHHTHYRDFNCAFKLVEGSLLRSLPLEAKGLNYSTEVTSKLLERGVTLIEVAIDHRPRVAGQSSLRLVRGAIHRFVFVLYVGLRQLMLHMGVLQRVPS